MGIITPGAPATPYIDSITHLVDIDTRAIHNDDFGTEDYILTNVKSSKERTLFQVERVSDLLSRHIKEEENDYEKRISYLENMVEMLMDKFLSSNNTSQGVQLNSEEQESQIDQ